MSELTNKFTCSRKRTALQYESSFLLCTFYETFLTEIIEFQQRLLELQLNNVGDVSGN